LSFGTHDFFLDFYSFECSFIYKRAKKECKIKIGHYKKLNPEKNYEFVVAAMQLGKQKFPKN